MESVFLFAGCVPAARLSQLRPFLVPLCYSAKTQITFLADGVCDVCVFGRKWHYTTAATKIKIISSWISLSRPNEISSRIGLVGLIRIQTEKKNRKISTVVLQRLFRANYHHLTIFISSFCIFGHTKFARPPIYHHRVMPKGDELVRNERTLSI